IVQLAFGLILGAIAVAVALSYGLGGREAAGEHFRDIIQKFRNASSESSSEVTGNRTDLPGGAKKPPIPPKDLDDDKTPPM
ncbi:MAG: hypothetical protein WBL27_01580, partial [Salinimicrobium sp.]